MPKLTQPTLAKLGKPATGRREVPDAGTGVSLVLYASGRASYVMRFRRNGRAAKLTLGRADLRPDAKDVEEAAPVIGTLLTLASARALAADVQRRRAGGRDVVAVREIPTPTFDAAARRYVDEHARPKNRTWRATAQLLGFDPNNDLAVRRGGLAHRWRDRQVGDITGDDIFSVVDGCSSEGRARFMFSTLSPLFGWLVARRVVKRNPCAGVFRPGAPPARDRVLTDDEVRKFWAAAGGLGYPFGPLLQLLLILGQRREEVAGMRWSELRDGLWVIPAERTKNKREHIVPLPPMAERLLPKDAPGDFVFSTTGSTPASGFSRTKRRLDAAMGSIAPWRVHDLRRTAATGMARLGQPVHVIEAVLNHRSGTIRGVAAVYNRYSYANEKRSALEAWSSSLAGIVGDGTVLRSRELAMTKDAAT